MALYMFKHLKNTLHDFPIGRPICKLDGQSEIGRLARLARLADWLEHIYIYIYIYI